MPIYNPNATIWYYTYGVGDPDDESPVFIATYYDGIEDDISRTALRFVSPRLMDGTVTQAILKLTISSPAGTISDSPNGFIVYGLDVDQALPASGALLDTRSFTHSPNNITFTDAEVVAVGTGNTIEIDITSWFIGVTSGSSFNIYLQPQKLGDQSQLDFSAAWIEAAVEGFTLDKPLDDVDLDAELEILEDANFALNKTLDEVDLDTEVRIQIKADLDQPLGACTLSSLTKVLIQGELNQGLDDVNLSTYLGDSSVFLLSRSLGGTSLEATAEILIQAYLNQTLDDVELVAQYMDEAPILGFVDKTLDDVTLDAEAVALAQWQLDQTLDDVTLDGSLVDVDPYILTVTLDGVTLNAKYFINASSMKDRGIFPSKVFLGNKNAIFN